MKRYSTRLARRTRPRRAFTLIEILVVISIIIVLVAMLIPAVSSARNTMRVAEVRQEITQLEGAIADFKFKFGHEPPSSITLYEDPMGWQNDPQSRATIRKFWPKFDFTVAHNFGGGGSGVFNLKGDQCLVFFLGGGFLNGGTPSAKFIGFSGDPTNPFKPTSASSSTRVGPFFNFDMGRILDDASSGFNYAAPLTSFPVYIDPFPGQRAPYLYATSYDGLGYNDSGIDSDVHTAASDNPATPAGTADFRIYRTDTKANATDPDPPAWKPNGYQIISPGPDGLYGSGGPYKPDANIVLPAWLKSGGNDVVDTTGRRNFERDNITNFVDGQLNY